MKKFGIRISGCEKPIEELVISYLNLKKNDLWQDFKYLEIGAAGCVTMRAMFDIIKENITHDTWKVIGVDIDGGWSIDWEQIHSCFPDITYYNNRVTTLEARHGDAKKIELWIDKNPRELVSNNFQGIDICFVDGCHGKNCVIDDFLCIEKQIKKNGIVIFHDVGVIEQGTDWQSHCEEFINVRSGLYKLGLFENKYPGWIFLGEIVGTRQSGGDGNNCAVFQKL